MKYSFLFSALILVALSSCKKTQPSSDTTIQHDWKFDSSLVDKIVHIDNDSTKEGMKLHLEFSYPSSYSNDTILNYVQNVFVHAYAGDSINLKPKDAFNKIEKECTQQALEYGDEARDDSPDFSSYFQSIVTSISDSSDIQNYMTAKTQIEQYTGGAHGMHNTQYFNIDTRTGDYISEDVLFEPMSKSVLQTIIKDLLIEKTKVTDGSAITLLEPDAIEPNGNFYFSKNGIVYVFNTYEVAPYSDGLIEITIPYERVKDILSPNYSFLIKSESEKK